jgi:hypothetical protein
MEIERKRKCTEICLSRTDELSDSVEASESRPDSSCNDNRLSTPAPVNGKVPTKCSWECAAFDFQTTFEGPLVRDGSKRVSNDLCARVEAKADLMYQLEFEPGDSPPAMESAR